MQKKHTYSLGNKQNGLNGHVADGRSATLVVTVSVPVASCRFVSFGVRRDHTCTVLSQQCVLLQV